MTDILKNLDLEVDELTNNCNFRYPGILFLSTLSM